MSDKTDSESCVKTFGDVLEIFEPYLDENDILEVIEELESKRKEQYANCPLQEVEGVNFPELYKQKEQE